MLEQQVHFKLGEDNPNVYLFAVYSYEGRQYVYKATKGVDIFVEWVKSLGIFLANIFHNIFVKCIYVLAVKLLYICGVKFSKDVMNKVNLMWDCGTCWKAWIALIVHIFLNILSIITFCLFTTELNRLSGYIEMKILGDENSECTLEKRLKQKKYLAPCQQPFAIISKGKEIHNLTSSTFKNPIYLLELISEDQRRKVASKIDSFINSITLF